MVGHDVGRVCSHELRQLMREPDRIELINRSAELGEIGFSKLATVVAAANEAEDQAQDNGNAVTTEHGKAVVMVVDVAKLQQKAKNNTKIA
jgi:hypothetical protein